MAKKQFCDYCEKEIDIDLSDEVSIYNHASEEDVFEADMCEKCMKKILKFLKDKEGIIR